MPNIIDNTFFKYDLSIPQAVAQVSYIDDQPTNVDYLTDCITYVEKNLLVNALGLTAYNELQLALPITISSEQKWKDLVSGVEYDGKIWEGLGNPKSLIAYAVYYHFLDENSSFWAISGVEKPQHENSQNVTPIFKLATAYQKFLKKYQEGFCGEPFIALVDNIWYADYYGDHDNIYVSLFQFLRDKKDVYEWEENKFRHYNQINTFGL